MMARIKKNDIVLVLSGKDKGKTGLVIGILPKKDKVMVKDVAVATRHAKARKQGEVSSIKKEERFIALSKVMPICGSCKQPTRVNVKLLDDGSKVRVCNCCKEIF
jgi:large subunit ribosomal protein L24